MSGYKLYMVVFLFLTYGQVIAAPCESPEELIKTETSYLKRFTDQSFNNVSYETNLISVFLLGEYIFIPNRYKISASSNFSLLLVSHSHFSKSYLGCSRKALDFNSSMRSGKVEDCIPCEAVSGDYEEFEVIEKSFGELIVKSILAKDGLRSQTDYIILKDHYLSVMDINPFISEFIIKQLVVGYGSKESDN